MALLTRLGRALRPALLAAALAATGASARASEFTAAEVEAAFLFNFPQFTTWPEGALPEPGSALVVGVLGADTFEGRLETLVEGASAHGRPIAVRRFASVEEAKGAHVLYVSRSLEPALGQVLAALRGLPVLVVSDIPAFAARGGMIGMVAEGERVRLEVNQEPVEAARLSLSSKLLRAARLVTRGQRR